jgi:hypothetical protein
MDEIWKNAEPTILIHGMIIHLSVSTTMMLNVIIQSMFLVMSKSMDIEAVIYCKMAVDATLATLLSPSRRHETQMHQCPSNFPLLPSRTSSHLYISLWRQRPLHRIFFPTPILDEEISQMRRITVQKVTHDSCHR